MWLDGAMEGIGAVRWLRLFVVRADVGGLRATLRAGVLILREPRAFAAAGGGDGDFAAAAGAIVFRVGRETSHDARISVSASFRNDSADFSCTLCARSRVFGGCGMAKGRPYCRKIGETKVPVRRSEPHHVAWHSLPRPV